MTSLRTPYTPFGLIWRTALIGGFVLSVPLFVCVMQAVYQEFGR